MTARVIHAKVSGKPQGSDPTRVYGNHWDADHTLENVPSLDAANTYSGAQSFQSALDLQSGQIIFPAVANPSSNPNTLDDYEEGTFTPSVMFATPGDLSISGTGPVVGRYTKIGRIVYGSVVFQRTLTFTTASSYFKLTGLPFPCGALFHGAGSVALSGYTKSGFTSLHFETAQNDTFFYVYATGSGQTGTELVASNFTTATQITLQSAFQYEI